jgi:hypothetical protein
MAGDAQLQVTAGDVQPQVTAGDALLPAAAIRRQAAAVAVDPRTAAADRRTVADRRTAGDRTAVDMEGNTALDSFPA